MTWVRINITLFLRLLVLTKNATGLHREFVYEKQEEFNATVQFLLGLSYWAKSLYRVNVVIFSFVGIWEKLEGLSDMTGWHEGHIFRRQSTSGGSRDANVQPSHRGGLDVLMEPCTPERENWLLQVCCQELCEELTSLWVGVLCVRVPYARPKVGSGCPCYQKISW